jgi:translation elongation factor EF-1alpha
MTRHTKRHFTIAVVGPQNSGKSTLCGQILSQLSAGEDGKSKNIWSEDERIGLPNVMDFLDQERMAQKTIESGLAVFESEEYRYSIFDTPGDPQYFQSMLAVAALTDFIIYVVSAKFNDFEKEFSKTPANVLEQLLLLKNLGIKNLVIAVNKMDTVNWKE